MPRVTITVLEKSPQPYRFDLNREIVNIGRNLENDIVVGCGSVSGKHAEMHRVKGGYELIDVESTNGIKIDGIRHKKVILDTGMVVKLGDVEFGFSLSEDELAELASEVQLVELPVAGFDDEDSVDGEDSEGSEKPSSKLEDKEEEEDPDEDDKRKKHEKAKKREEAEKREEDKKAKKRANAEKREKAEKQERREKAKKGEQSDDFSESKLATIGSGFILFALIAIAAAFLYGANARHNTDTGESLLKAVVNKEDVKKDAPTEVQDKTDPDSE